jgi:hypothetical protein
MSYKNREQKPVESELSDEDLDLISGGIPTLGNTFAGDPYAERVVPKLHVLQDRPDGDPDLWF